MQSPSTRLEAGKRRDVTAFSAGCLGLFGLPFALGGLAAWFQAFREFQAGKHKQALMLGLFGLVFCGAGFGLIAAAILGKRWQRSVSERQSQHPDAPWLWREDWAAGEVRPGQRKAVVMMWIFAAFWNVMSWTLLLAFLTDRGTRDKAVYMVGLFPLIGLVLLWIAVSSTFSWRRFGHARFRLATLPAAPGEVLMGTAEIPGSLPNDVPVFLRITCARRVVERSGKEQRTRDETLWQDERLLRPGLPQSGPGEVNVPVFFRLPEDAPASSTDTGDGSVHWTLEVHAKIPGPNLQLEFEVPVFDTGVAVAAPEPDPTLPYQMPIDELRRHMDSKIRITDGPEGAEIYFPAARHPGGAFFTGLFFLVWTGAIGFSVRAGAPIVFPIILGLFDLVLAFAFSEFALRSSRLRATRESLWSRQRWLWIGRTREIPASEISDFSATAGSSSGRQSYYDLKVHKRDGKEMKLATLIGSKAEAEWLRAELRAKFGISPQPPG